jgi:hypothetical protein
MILEQFGDDESKAAQARGPYASASGKLQTASDGFPLQHRNLIVAILNGAPPP